MTFKRKKHLHACNLNNHALWEFKVLNISNNVIHSNPDCKCISLKYSLYSDHVMSDIQYVNASRRTRARHAGLHIRGQKKSGPR